MDAGEEGGEEDGVEGVVGEAAELEGNGVLVGVGGWLMEGMAYHHGDCAG